MEVTIVWFSNFTYLWIKVNSILIWASFIYMGKLINTKNSLFGWSTTPTYIFLLLNLDILTFWSISSTYPPCSFFGGFQLKLFLLQIFFNHSFQQVDNDIEFIVNELKTSFYFLTFFRTI